jgi:hypothetical protein
MGKLFILNYMGRWGMIQADILLPFLFGHALEEGPTEPGRTETEWDSNFWHILMTI